MTRILSPSLTISFLSIYSYFDEDIWNLSIYQHSNDSLKRVIYVAEFFWVYMSWITGKNDIGCPRDYVVSRTPFSA